MLPGHLTIKGSQVFLYTIRWPGHFSITVGMAHSQLELARSLHSYRLPGSFTVGGGQVTSQFEVAKSLLN